MESGCRWCSWTEELEVVRTDHPQIKDPGEEGTVEVTMCRPCVKLWDEHPTDRWRAEEVGKERQPG